MTPPLSTHRRSKTPPPGETGQEALYLRSLSDRQVPVSVKLCDGETVRGWIEYFDDGMLRLTREGKPNLFIYKHQIQTITEQGRRRSPRSTPRWDHVVSDTRSTAPILDMGSESRGDRARRLERVCASFLQQGVETEYKGDVDLVTVADRTVEKLIRTRLAEVFPDHGIYGEEGTREGMDREFRWYVDPLDGTTNFAHGFPQFCVSMGLEQRPAGLKPDEDGSLVAGVIYDPMRDELFVAEKGTGAMLNGKPMHVSTIPTLAEALLATGFPSRKRHPSPNIHFYHEFTLRSHGVRRAGSAALDLAYVAAGRTECFLGVQSESLGYSGRNSAGGGGWRARDGLCRRQISD